jgi:hypothetical protein
LASSSDSTAALAAGGAGDLPVGAAAVKEMYYQGSVWSYTIAVRGQSGSGERQSARVPALRHHHAIEPEQAEDCARLLVHTGDDEPISACLEPFVENDQRADADAVDHPQLVEIDLDEGGLVVG